MSVFAWHVDSRLSRDRVIAPDTAARRKLAAAVFDAARDAKLLCFHVPDTHLHLLVVAGRELAGRLVQAVGSAVTQRLGLGVGFAPAHFEPVETQRHLANAFHYVLGQKAHHQSVADPLHEASNLPDLLGLRLAGRFTIAHVREHLPRVRRPDLLAHFGVAGLDAGTSPVWLADAAAAAALSPSLVGRTAPVVAARRAAVHLARGVGIGRDAIAAVLGITPRAVTRLIVEPSDPALVDAIARQIGLRERLGQARLSPPMAGEEAAGYDAGSDG